MTTKTKTRNRYFQPNPKKNDKVGDCVVRAMCKATDKDWDTVFKRLCNIAYKMKAMPNSDDVWQAYLIEHGFVYNKLSVKRGSKRPTVDSFTRDNKAGTFVLRVANHVVTAQDGYSYDTWDSSDCSMYGYWSKQN